MRVKISAPVVGVAVLAMCGCSFIGVRGPRTQAPGQTTVTCTQDFVPPVVDTVVAVAGIGAFAVLEPKLDGPMADGAQVALIPPAAIGLLAAVSAVYGYVEISACPDARPK